MYITRFFFRICIGENKRIYRFRLFFKVRLKIFCKIILLIKLIYLNINLNFMGNYLILGLESMLGIISFLDVFDRFMF